jgi:hypothetical protein
VGDELKRFAIICGLVLVAALALLLPFAKWGVPKRPPNVPSTAAFANGGVAGSYWIDCWNFAGANRYSCTLYRAKGGETFLKGIFQEMSITEQRRIFYDGLIIHWRHGQLLRPLQLECVAGGRSPTVADCKTITTRSN